jgi:GNAT superfamily N-acetyltransferase
MSEIEIILERDRIDFARWSQLTLESYWGDGRTDETNRKAFANSVCVAASIDGRQVGFGRVVTDYAIFAYMADVLVEPDARGKGVGQALIRSLLERPLLGDVKRWSLRTADAHSLYERFGFVTANDGYYMLRVKD